MTLVFSHGSNGPSHLAALFDLDPTTVQARSAAAVAHGFQRRFVGVSDRWGGGVSTLVPVRGGVTGGTLTLLTADEVAVMDEREEVPAGSYRRDVIEVYTEMPSTGTTPPGFPLPDWEECGKACFRAHVYLATGPRPCVPAHRDYLESLATHLTTWFPRERVLEELTAAQTASYDMDSEV